VDSVFAAVFDFFAEAESAAAAPFVSVFIVDFPSCFVAAARAPANVAPLTVRPSAENFAALPSPMPLTRTTMSFQSLNGAFLRSSSIFAEITGPMPLIDSSSACVALFTSTAANAAAASSDSSAARSFFSISLLRLTGRVQRSARFGCGDQHGSPSLQRNVLRGR
jgi:hypothetical protein